MEIKAQLEKPYTEEERLDFIVRQNHTLGYEIRETGTALQALKRIYIFQRKQQKTSLLMEA